MIPKGCYDMSYEYETLFYTYCGDCGHTYNSKGCLNVRRIYNLELVWE